MKILESIKRETLKMAADFAKYDMELYEKHIKVMDTDLSKYAEGYQEKRRQELWDKAMDYRDQAFTNFLNFCTRIEDRLKPSFDNVSLLEQRKRFAEEKGLTLAEADSELERYINNADVSIDVILDQGNPHYTVFADALRKSGRIKENPLLASKLSDKSIRDTLSMTRNRIDQLQNASIHYYPYDSGNAALNKLTIQEYEKYEAEAKGQN